VPTTLLATLPGKVPSNRGLSSLQWAPNSLRLGVMVQHSAHAGAPTDSLSQSSVWIFIDREERTGLQLSSLSPQFRIVF